MNDYLRIAPQGDALLVTPCDPALPAFVLQRDWFGDVQNLLSTPEGTDWLGCQYFNDMDNYPILACQDGKGGLFTLWPGNGDTPACDG
ncbi:MAG: hypothetical protein R3D63_13540 [Paracoccaceae bacterium]